MPDDLNKRNPRVYSGSINRTSLTLFFLTALSISARAQIPVTDYGALAQRAQKSIVDAYSQAANFAKYAATELNSYETAVYTYEQKLNSYEQLFRYGTAANTIGRIPGVSTVANLYQTSQRLQSYYKNWQYTLNPQNLRYDANSILDSYQRPSLASYATPGGYQFSPSAFAYQFDTAAYNAASNAQTVMDRLQKEKQDYEQELITATRLHDSARTDQDARKYGEAVASIHKKIDHVNQDIQQTSDRESLQQRQIQSAQRISQTAVADQADIDRSKAIQNDLAPIPSGDFDKTSDCW
jgi:hypothetical protein